MKRLSFTVFICICLSGALNISAEESRGPSIDPGLAVILNLVPVFAWGSNLQGDEEGASIGFWCELGGIALMAGGITLDHFFWPWGTAVGVPGMVAGGMLFVGANLYEIFRPFNFIEHKNTALYMMLNVVPGFGVGSFLQGNAVMGVLQLILEGGGAACAASSLLFASGSGGALGGLNMVPYLLAGGGAYAAGKIIGFFSALLYN